MKTIVVKLGNMRKAVDWVVYPGEREGGGLVIQSDRRIALIRPDGTGALSKSKNFAGFADLAKFLGAVDIEVPAEVYAEAAGAKPKSGDRIGSVGIIA